MNVPRNKRKPRPLPKPKPLGGNGTDGRPPFEPTDQQRAMVKMLAIAGYKQHEICKAIRNPATDEHIDQKTMTLHFRPELDVAFFETAALTMGDFIKKLHGAPARYNDKGKMLRKEVLSDTRAQIFFFSSRLKDKGWSTRVEHTGKNGGAIDLGDLRNIHELDDEQLAQFIDAVESRIAAGNAQGRAEPPKAAPKRSRKKRG